MRVWGGGGGCSIVRLVLLAILVRARDATALAWLSTGNVLLQPGMLQRTVAESSPCCPPLRHQDVPELTVNLDCSGISSWVYEAAGSWVHKAASWSTNACIQLLPIQYRDCIRSYAKASSIRGLFKLLGRGCKEDEVLSQPSKVKDQPAQSVR